MGVRCGLSWLHLHITSMLNLAPQLAFLGEVMDEVVDGVKFSSDTAVLDVMSKTCNIQWLQNMAGVWSDQPPLPLSKRRHVEEFPNVLFEPLLISEEEGQVHSGKVSQYDQDLLNQESKPPSYEVLDLERRETALNQPPHQDVTTGFVSDVLERREIPPSEEDMPEIASYQPESHDEGQPIVGPCSPTDSLASGSRRLRELQISEHGRPTPRTPTPPIVARAQEDTSQKPQTAQVVGNSELCAACPIVDIRELPSQSRSLEEICNEREIPDGGLAVYVALPHVVRKMYDIHQKMLSLFGSVGLQNIYLTMPSSAEKRFQVFIAPDVEKLSENFKTMDLESDVAKHRKGRLDDVKALEPFVKFVHDLAEEYRIHVSKKIYKNLQTALEICGNARDGSYLAKVYQALEGKTCVSLVEVYVEIEGSCEKFPIVCLEGEKILLVVEEWLMKNHKGRRLSDFNLRLVTCDQPSYPVEESMEVFRRVHQVQLVYSMPSAAALVPPPPPLPGPLYGVPPPQNRHLFLPPPPICHRDGTTRCHPPYPPSPSIAGCGQRPPAVVGPGTVYRPSHVAPQSVDRQPWDGTRR